MGIACVSNYLSEQLVAVEQFECWTGDEEEATWALGQAWNLQSIVETARNVRRRHDH